MGKYNTTPEQLSKYSLVWKQTKTWYIPHTWLLPLLILTTVLFFVALARATLSILGENEFVIVGTSLVMLPIFMIVTGYLYYRYYKYGEISRHGIAVFREGFQESENFYPWDIVESFDIWAHGLPQDVSIRGSSRNTSITRALRLKDGTSADIEIPKDQEVSFENAVASLGREDLLMYKKKKQILGTIVNALLR